MEFDSHRRQLLQVLGAGGLFLGFSGRAGATVRTLQQLGWDAPEDLLEAIATEHVQGTVVDVEYRGEPEQVDVFETELQGFPLDIDEPNPRYVILSTGRAADAPGHPTEFVSTDVGGRFFPNFSPDEFDAYDVAEIRIDIAVPEEETGIAFDYRFGTEENPQFLGDQFQDFFEVSLLRPDAPPENVARLPDGQPVTVDNADAFANSPGGTSEFPEPPFPEPEDVTYNSVTELLTAGVSLAGVQGEVIRLILRVGDASDEIYDSAVFLDNLRFTDEVDVPQGLVATRLEEYGETVLWGMERHLRAVAERDAKLYEAHGEDYAEEVVRIVGYMAGEVPADELDDELVELFDAIGQEVDPTLLQPLYAFYDSLFEQASPEPPPTEPFVSYFWDHFPLVGQEGEQSTHAELADEYEAVYAERTEAFLQEVDASDFDANEVDHILKYLAARTDELVESTIRDVNTIEEETELLVDADELEGRLDEVRVPLMEDEEIGGGPVFSTIVVLSWVLKHTAFGKGILLAAKAKGLNVGSWVSGLPGVHTVKTYLGGSALAGSIMAQGSKLAASLVTATNTKAFYYAHTAEAILHAWKLANYGEEMIAGTGLDPRRQEPDLGADGPQDALDVMGRDASILTLDLENITILDAVESEADGLVGQQRGHMVIENTGTSTFAPVPQFAVWADTLLPIGGSVSTPFPVSLVEKVPPIGPGEVVSIEFEYLVPINLLPTTYSMYVNVYGTGAGAVDTFEAGLTEPVDILRYTVLEGEVADGDSATTTIEPSPDTHVLNIELTYDGFDADLHLYDEVGNHTGLNYETSELENDIPGATHTGADEGVLGREVIRVQDPASDVYVVEVVAAEVDTIVVTEEIASALPPAGTLGARPVVGIDLAQTNEATGINVAFEASVTETPLLDPVLAVTSLGAPPVVEHDEEVTLGMEVAEVGGYSGAEDLEVTVSDLDGPDGEFRIGTVQAPDSRLDIDAGRVATFEVEVAVPDDVRPDRYVGTVSLVDEVGTTVGEGEVHLVVVGEWGEGLIFGLATEEVLVAGAVGLGLLYLVFHHLSGDEGA